MGSVTYFTDWTGPHTTDFFADFVDLTPYIIGGDFTMALPNQIKRSTVLNFVRDELRLDPSHVKGFVLDPNEIIVEVFEFEGNHKVYDEETDRARTRKVKFRIV